MTLRTSPPLSFLTIPLVEWMMRRQIHLQRCQFPIIRRHRLELDLDRWTAFEGLWRSIIRRRTSDRLIEYDLPYPKIEFLHYLCDIRGLVAHGSTRTDLDVLKPIRLSRDNNEFGNREQIFASPDAVWAVWFAVLDKSRIHQTSNACVRVGPRWGKWTKLYYFHLPRKVKESKRLPFVDGMIYIAHPGDFPFHRPLPGYQRLGIEIEEWGSTQPVVPLARLPFKWEEFPYRDRVEYTLD